MAAILDFNGSGRLGREKFVLRGRSTVKIKERSGVKRLSSRCQSQAKCVIWTFCSFGEIRNMANSVNDEVVSFNSALGKALKNPSGFNVPRALRSEQKEATSALLFEEIYWACYQLAFRKA